MSLQCCSILGKTAYKPAKAPHHQITSTNSLKRATSERYKLELGQQKSKKARKQRKANMSFGFSVGDFIAISGLIRTLVDALDSDTGSRAQYSRLSDELKSLQSALLAVQDLVQKPRRDGKSYVSTINAITYEMKCCRKVMEDFNADMEKYRESLCHGGSRRKVKDVWREIRYKIFKEEDVVMLKDSLGRRVEAINLLLLVAGMYDMFLFFSPHSFDRGRVRQTGGPNEQASIRQDISHGLLSPPVY